MWRKLGKLHLLPSTQSLPAQNPPQATYITTLQTTNHIQMQEASSHSPPHLVIPSRHLGDKALLPHPEK